MKPDACALNTPLAALPPACEVLVVGAGPAGSAAARTLAQAGVDVVLVDQHAFPRDKVCGDGLIPDAHNALRRLGVFDAVMARARRASHAGCIAPRGRRIDVPASLAVLPRRELDLVLCQAAADAGARMAAPARFVAPLEQTAPHGGSAVVVGARLQARDAQGRPLVREIRARWVVLATGAVPQALQAAGLCERRTPSAVALRGYVRNPRAPRRATLDVVWHRRLRSGYGWIFPCPDGVYNVGVGVGHSHVRGRDGRHAMQDVNLREMFDAFLAVHAPARELVDSGQWLGELKGAPLRCSLEGGRYSRAGLLVAGEAAGSTYAFTGEGIGKALETGLLAAQALLRGLREAAPDAAVRAGYEAQLLALKPRFALYERATRVNDHPWLVDLLVWSAHRSPSRLRRMSGVLEETHAPSSLTGWKSWLRLMFETG